MAFSYCKSPEYHHIVGYLKLVSGADSKGAASENNVGRRNERREICRASHLFIHKFMDLHLSCCMSKNYLEMEKRVGFYGEKNRIWEAL